MENAFKDSSFENNSFKMLCIYFWIESLENCIYNNQGSSRTPFFFYHLQLQSKQIQI